MVSNKHSLYISKFVYIDFFFWVTEDVESLVLSERLETTVPLSYIAVMAMAYYGPNAEILGTVKLRIWQSQTTIEDFGEFAMTLGVLLVVDFMSFVVNAILLWKFCKINSMEVLKNIQKRYWFVMVFAEAGWLFIVSLLLINNNCKYVFLLPFSY